MRDTVSSLRREFPSISIAVYTDCSPAAVRELLELSKVGVDEVLIRNVDDARTSLRNVVSAAKRRRADDAVLEVLTARTSEHVRPILEYILRRANRPITVEEVARGLGVHRKTLLNRLSAVGSPCPSALVSWCRLIAASRLLQDPGRSVEQVAQLVGFGSASALRNMLRRHAGMAPSEVRARGYCSDLVDALVCQRSARPTADVAP
jgi:AraC-like DNA-binding protein